MPREYERTLVQLGNRQFPHGSPVIAPIGSRNHLLCWGETSFGSNFIKARVLNPLWNPVGTDMVVPVASNPFAFDVAPRANNGAVIAWNDGKIVKLRFVDSIGNLDGEIEIGVSNKQILKVDVRALFDDAFAISWRDFMIIRQGNTSTLASSTPSAWHSTMSVLNNGNIVRITAYEERAPYGTPPIYGLEGSLFTPLGQAFGRFRFDIPATIVGDTFSHPEDLSACPLSNGGFVVTWTQLAHHLGNSIQCRQFSEDGSPLGETLVVASADTTSHVEASAVIPTGDGEFLVGWSRDEGSGVDLTAQMFSTDGNKLGIPLIVTNGPVEGRREGLRFIDISGTQSAIWSEGKDIKITTLKSYAN